LNHCYAAPLRRQRVVVRLFAILGSIAIAVITVLAQLWLKLLSRVPPNGRKIATIAKEDCLWWTDWVVIGTITLLAKVLLPPSTGAHATPEQLWIGVISLLVGYSLLPIGIKLFLYDNEGEIKGWRHVIVANFAGLLILFAAVTGGAHLID